MDSLTAQEVRASLVNCSQGEARRANLPPDLGSLPWDDLDFLGWTDPKAPLVSYLVAPTERGLTGIALRRGTAGPGRKVARMCSLCTTVHSGQGVVLLVARRAGKAGREGNTVGIDACNDLSCSLYVRGKLPLPVLSPAAETLSVEERIARLRRNVERFVERVRG